MMTGDTSHPYTGVQGSGPRRRLTRETSKVAPFALRLAATAITLALATTYAAADGIPGVVMTDSQYVTDWSGFYIGGKLGGAFSSSINWTQDENVFSASSGAAAAPNTPLDFSPNGSPAASSGAPTFSLGSGFSGPRCRSRVPTCRRKPRARSFRPPIRSQPRSIGSSQLKAASATRGIA